MSCTQCQDTQPVPECVSSIVIGVIALLSTPVHVFVKNNTTNYVHIQEATSAADGTITLDSTLPDISFYNKNHLYEIWVTGIADLIKLPITINSIDYDCLLIQFEKIAESHYTEFTLSV